MDTAHEHNGFEYWGLLDTQDNVWIGNDDGPILLADYATARIAAQMSDVLLGQESGRTRAVPYKAQSLRLRDRQMSVMSPEEALRRLETGEAI